MPEQLYFSVTQCILGPKHRSSFQFLKRLHSERSCKGTVEHQECTVLKRYHEVVVCFLDMSIKAGLTHNLAQTNCAYIMENSTWNTTVSETDLTSVMWSSSSWDWASMNSALNMNFIPANIGGSRLIKTADTVAGHCSTHLTYMNLLNHHRNATS